MTSFISHFRPWFIACAAALMFEVGYNYVADPRPVDRTNILDFRIGVPPNLQRLFAFEKIERLTDSRPTIIQVGDSSGFHAVIPSVVEALLPGERYVNMSVATTLGYGGYLALAEHMLKNNPTIRHVVLVTSMACGYPRFTLWDENQTAPPELGGQRLLGQDLRLNLIDPLRTTLQLPSLALREEMNQRLFAANGLLTPIKMPRHSNFAYAMLHEIMPYSSGWLRETDNAEDIQPDLWSWWRPMTATAANRRLFDTLCPETVDDAWDPWRLSRITYVDVILGRFAEVAKRYGAKLIVVPNPMAQGIKAHRNFTPVEAALKSFADRHPDVSVHLPFEHWPDYKFSVFAHVSTPFAVESSIWFARAIAQHLKSDGRPTEASADRRPAFPQQIVAAASGNFSHYGFTAPVVTGTTSYRQTWPGRSEALLHAFIAPMGRPLRFRLDLSADPTGASAEQITAAIFGTKLEKSPTCEGPQPCVQFAIPPDLISRYGGFLEILLSTRGRSTWPEAQTTDRPDSERIRFTAFQIAPIVERSALHETR